MGQCSRSIYRWCPLWREGKFGILVVDDEPSVLMTYRLILEKRGYAVHTARTCAEALSMLQQHRYDMLLCDYSLEQEHTGFEVIHAGRNIDPNVTAMLLTGYASKETVERAHQIHVKVLFKPIDIEEFFGTLEHLKRGKDAGKGQEQKDDKDKQERSRKSNGKSRRASY
jgi:DNA-binding NtrC family response regulator